MKTINTEFLNGTLRQKVNHLNYKTWAILNNQSDYYYDGNDEKYKEQNEKDIKINQNNFLESLTEKQKNE